jgi:DNA-binding NtrC family response regulator
MLEFAERAAQSAAPVLILGETGTGKTVLARLIHNLGPRASKPFKRVNCGGVPESLFEREMFGHMRGAFSDAKESQPGFFEAADRGSLFLDEIGELPLSVQPKLLAALEEKYIRRIGSTSEVHLDVRIIAATNRDLRAMVAGREFREDLFFRLGFLKYQVPPLRERMQQLPEIIRCLLLRICTDSLDHLGAPPSVHPEALQLLHSYHWPGNIRELEQVLTYAGTFFPGPLILPEHLPPDIFLDNGCFGGVESRAGPGKPRYTAPICPHEEKQLILDALHAEKGNRTRAAARLGMSRATLWVKLREYGSGPPHSE